MIEEDESRRGQGRGSPRFYKILAKASGARAPSVFPHPDEVAKILRRGEGSKTGVQELQEIRDAAAGDASRISCSSCTPDSTPLPPTQRKPPSDKGNGQKPGDLTASQRIAATRESGGTLTLWPDEAGFDIDVRAVSDPMIRDLLLASIDAGYAAILGELRRELKTPAPEGIAAK